MTARKPKDQLQKRGRKSGFRSEFIRIAEVAANRRPDHWRDVQNIEARMGHYVISERPMTEEEWIREHCSNGKQLEHEASPALSKTE